MRDLTRSTVQRGIGEYNSQTWAEVHDLHIAVHIEGIATRGVVSRHLSRSNCFEGQSFFDIVVGDGWIESYRLGQDRSNWA